VENEQSQTAVYEGWAIVEMMGHRREIGYVTTEHFGSASLFRVDSPEFEEREFELVRPQYVEGRFAPAGSKVKRQAIPAKSCLVGPGSVYALNPCTEETARKAIERSIDRPLILLSIPDRPQLETAAVIDVEDEGLCVQCGQAECACDPF
jgi:hypothetical protein